jgi:hypothetical protein
MALVAVWPSLSRAQDEVPADLTDPNPMVRLVAVQEVEREKIVAAEATLSTLVKEDAFDAVREAACKALQAIEATDKIDLLADVAANDANENVRIAAHNAVKALRLLITNATYKGESKYRQPKLTVEKEEPKTRRLGIGLGTMGGLGFVALDLRGRIPTRSEYLPFVGIEFGGGWTPPALYPVTAGPVGKIDNQDYKWRIFSGALSVLLYFHRMHYGAVRVGFDVGRGPYALFTYGFEFLNDNGFFSWGLEAGILTQPGIETYIDNLVTCEEDNSCNEDRWPVIPCVRFSLHLYPI